MLDQNGVLVNLAVSGSAAAPAASPSPGTAVSAGSVSYTPELIWAAVIVAAVLALAALVWWLWGSSKGTTKGSLFVTAKGGLLVGVDNRISTSKTIAAA